MRSVLTRVAATVATVAAAAVGLSAPAVAATDKLAPPITWEACPEVVTDPTAECGRIDVPMYYSDPAGATISVGFVRVPATGESRGTLFGNPGGPGGDAYSYFGTPEAFQWPEGITSEWDRVAVQPRGLAGSTPVNCTSDPGYSVVDMNLRFGAFVKDACEISTPGYTNSLTTSNTAEDWEMVRRSLGLDQISIMGLSYGTFLGSVYASRYPGNTDRVVLDSAMDPNLAWNGILASQQEGYESALHNFMRWTAERNDVYGLGETPLAVYQSWSRKIVAESGTNPTVVPPPAQVGDIPPGLEWAGQSGADLLTATGKQRVEAEGVISRAQNPGATQLNSGTLSMTRALVPRAESWDALAKMINGTEPLPDTEFTPEMQAELTNSMAMQTMITCNENIVPPNPFDLPDYIWSSFVSGDPFTSPNAAFSSGAQCSGITPITTPPALDGSGLATRPLQVQATGDPQTPYEYRHTIQNAMGTQLVTVNGPGHGHVGFGNTAVDDIVVEYLRTGVAPATEAPGFSPS